MARNFDGDWSDTSSQCSRSSAGLSMSSMMSGSASQYHRYERMRPRALPSSSSSGMGDLFARLQAAEERMQTRDASSARSSDTSVGEGRDKGLMGEQILDELERRSARSASNKSGHSGQNGEDAGARAVKSADQCSSRSSDKNHGKGSHSSGQRSSVQMDRGIDGEKLEVIEAKEELAKLCDHKDKELWALEQKLEAEQLKKEAKEEENQLLLEAVRNREIDKLEHQTETKSLKVTKDTIQNKLYHVKKESELIKGQRDELADTLAEVKARHEIELRKTEQEMKAKTQREMMERLHEIQKEESAQANAKVNAKEAAKMLAAKLQAAEKEKLKAQKEADVLRVKEAMTKAEVTVKGAKLQAVQAEVAAERGEMAQSAPNASRLLQSVFEAERRLQDEMTELRRKMKSLDAKDSDYKSDMAQLQQQWDDASSRLTLLGTGEISENFQRNFTPPFPVSPAPTLNMNTRSFRSGWNKSTLPPITEGEDPSNDGSTMGFAPSDQFSSNADEGVGDLHDFDPAVEDPLGVLRQVVPQEHHKTRLEIEKAIKQKEVIAEDLEKKQQEKEILKERNAELQQREMALEMETAEKLAADESKIERLQHALMKRREADEENERLIMSLRQELGVKEVKTESVRERLEEVWSKAEAKEERLKRVRQELQTQEDEKVDLKVYSQGIRAQLEEAWEARRVAEMRCEDYRMCLEAQDERHEKALEYLRQEIRILKRCQGTEANAQDEKSDMKAELLAMRKEVKRLEEEKNILQNVLEWKEVQWQSTIESLEQQLAAQAAQFKKDMNRDQEDLLSKLDKRADTLKQRLSDKTFASGSTLGPVLRLESSESEQTLQQMPAPTPLSTDALEAAGVLSGEKLPTGSECNSSREISEVSEGDVANVDA